MRPGRVAVVLDGDDRSSVGRFATARSRIIPTVGDETVEDALHRFVGVDAVRGAVVGGVVLGVLTAVVAATLGADAAAAAGLGGAVGLTGGPFFGSLVGFCVALLRIERIRGMVGADMGRRRAVLVVGRSTVAGATTGEVATGVP